MNLLLHFPLSPGDTLCGEPAIASLKTLFPEYEIGVTGTAAKDIYENNPHVKFLDGWLFDKYLTMHYPVNLSGHRPIHLIEGYCLYLEEQLKIRIPCLFSAPKLYLSEQEKKWKSQVEEIVDNKIKFWVGCFGGKTDYTVKIWNKWQEVVNALKGKIQFVQVGEKHHTHQPLDNVINLLGKTDTRQLIRLCWNSVGGVGHVSFLHHIYAALTKPFVCVASGMESSRWEQYDTERYLCKATTLECGNHGKGCWKSRVFKLNDGSSKDKSICELPILGKVPQPKCMDMISVDEVVNAILGI